MSKKRTLPVIIILLCAGVFFSLFIHDKYIKKEKEIIISVGDWPRESSSRRAFYEEYAAIMKKKHNVVVVADEWSYSIDSFLPKAASGQLPNIYNTWFTESKKIIASGYAADITGPLRGRGWDQDINPVILPLVKENGRFYGIPRDAYLMGLMCNLDLFRKAGLVDAAGIPEIPQTFAELTETARTIKEQTGCAGFLIATHGNTGGWHFMNIAWSFGAEFIKETTNGWKAVFNSPEAVAALQYIKDLQHKAGVLPDTILIDWVKSQELIGTGRCAMKFEAGLDYHGFDYVIDNYHIDKDDIAMGSIPAGPAGRVALLGGNIYMVAPNSTDDQINAVLEWLRLMGESPDTSREGLRNMEEVYKNDAVAGYVVGNSGVPVWVNPEYSAAGERVKSQYINVNLDYFQEFLDFDRVTMRLEEPVNCQELYQILDWVIQTVLTDPNADPQDLLDRASMEFQKNYLDKVNR